LVQNEIKELNRLTTILLDIFEDQLDIGRLKTMAAAAGLLDKQFSDLGRSVLRSGGKVSSDDAKRYAEDEYETFKLRMRQTRHDEADQAIADVKRTLKKLR
jgi:hypothetical protein